MKRTMIHRACRLAAIALSLAAPALLHAQAPAGETVPVTADNFVRAESDRYFNMVVRQGGFGKFFHRHDLPPPDSTIIVRANRDTLYSTAVFDLDAGPVTITLPDAGKRFRSMAVINQDQHVPAAIYGAGTYTLDRKTVGTRYVLVGIRTLFDPASSEDRRQVFALQDAIKVEQKNQGRFEVPRWDPASQKKVRDALLSLADTVPDSRGMFGSTSQVTPVRHLIGSASAWGGNYETDAFYLNVTPSRNDGAAVYRLKVKDVPVDSFWSISVYNAAGFFEPNPYGAYTLNGITAKKGEDGSIAVQFGGCDGKIPNCLPVMPGWNYMVRLYKPRAEILSGAWVFPEAQPVR
jgi:hypothetical protein